MTIELPFIDDQDKERFYALPQAEQERIRAKYEARYNKRVAINQRKIDTFWDKLDKSGECWEWTGPRRGTGYGVHTIGRVSGAHRIAYALSHDGEVPEGMCVCHRCDNPPCCRPDHLFLGTSADNSRDMHDKGRARIHAEQRFRRDPLYIGPAEACRILGMSLDLLGYNVHEGLLTQYTAPNKSVHYLRSEVIELREAVDQEGPTTFEAVEAWKQEWIQRKAARWA